MWNWWTGQAGPFIHISVGESQISNQRFCSDYRIEPTRLLSYLSKKENQFHHVIGSKTSIRESAIKLRKRFLQGIAAAERLFPQRI